MNKKLCVALVLAALSTGYSVYAADRVVNHETDPAITEKALKNEASRINTERQVNTANWLLQKNLNPEDANVKAIPDAGTLDIDLKGVVATAIQNNRDITLSEYSLEKAAAQVSEAAAAKNPQFSASYEAARSLSGTTDVIANAYNSGINVTWPIWTGGSVEGAIESARYTADAAQVDVYQTEAATKLAATEAYYQYLEAINLADVAQESEDNLSQHLTNVQQQFNAGIVAKLDVLTSNVSLANAKQNNIAARNTRDVAEANLNNVMRIPMNTKLVPIDKNFPEPDMDLTMEQAIAMAEKYRWELIKADYNVKIAEQQLRVAKAGYMPTLAVGGGYNWQDTDFPGFENKGWNVAGTVSWNLWDGGATDAKIREAKADLKSAEETLLQTRESVELEVRQDYLNVFSAREQIRAAEAAVDEAEEAYKIATVRYGSGVGINLDVLDAQLQLNEARTNYITALYDYNIGLATLENAMGIPAVIHTNTSTASTSNTSSTNSSSDTESSSDNNDK